MSKAEERAFERYSITRGDDTQETSGIDLQRVSDFIDGYHQAEEDLRDISWIKEVSGVKELSRAKEEALKAYPPQSIAANYDTINRRDAFEYGYLKAEKDLELTWEDIESIHTLMAHQEVAPILWKCGYEAFYQEVLKRFKERK
jgi:hypothetical protein